MTKIDLELLGEEKMLVDIDEVRFVAWNAQKGELLSGLRGKKSRRQLAEEIKSLGGDCSHQNLKKLEYAQSEMVSVEILKSICLALGVPLTNFVTLYGLKLPKTAQQD